MVGFMGKRKELEQVVDGFSDFSLSAPASKTRRLDLGLPPIMEEEMSATSMAFEQQLSRGQISRTVSVPPEECMMGGATPSIPSSEDRALVLYKPVDSPAYFLPVPSNPSILVSADLIRGLKNHVLNQGNNHGLEDKSPERSNSLAMVPWVPPPITTISSWATSERASEKFEEPMEADEAGATSMEVEAEAPHTSAGATGIESPHQWQQHCMTPQALPNQSTPVMWLR